MINQLNSQFETMFLLCNCPWGDEQKEHTIAEMEKFGLEGTDFYYRYYHPIEQYYHIFTKNMIASEGTELLRDMDTVVLSVCASVFGAHPEWYTALKDIPEENVRDLIEKDIFSECEAEHGDLITALEAQPISDKAKWEMMVFVQRGKQYLLSIAEAVALNIPAYEKAAAKVENELKVLLEQFSVRMNSSDKTGILRLPGQMNPDAVVIPTLALPMAVLLVGDICFYGLLYDKVFAGADAQLTKEEVLIGAKALSEKSKVEILLCLKDESHFNLEIAELVGLTPATVSHHMNTLLATGFVEVEKRDGKVFYKLAADGIKRYLTGTSQLLLQTENT